MKIFLLLVIIPAVLFAQHDYNKTEHKQHTEHHFNHHIEVFLGATSGIYEDAETGFTAGLEYEYIMNSTLPVMGAGVILETVVFEETEFIVGLPIFVHPYLGFKFFVAPSMIFREEGEVSEVISDKHSIKFLEETASGNVIHSSNKFFIRMGAGYDFHFDNFAVTPTVSFDLIEAHSYLVYGVAFGILF
jgi:hypothetical protein